MMFRGTKNISAEKYQSMVARSGLDTNAFTSEDMTVYHLFGPAKALPTIIAMESDRFQNLDYTEGQFKTESGAILGEYAKSASDPESKMEEKWLETAYAGHTYRHTVIGYLEDIKNMPNGFAYSREFFRRYYTPDNATVVVVGDFDKQATLALMEKAYGGWKGKLDPVAIPAEPAQKQAKTAHLDWPTPTLPRLFLGWHAGNDLKTTAIATVLNGYLFGPTSALHQDLVLGRQLVDSIDPYFQQHRDPWLFGALIKVKDPAQLETVEKRVVEETALLAKGKVDKKRLEAVRSHLKYQVILGLNTADRLAVTLAVTGAITGDVDYLNKLYAAIDKLQPNELVAFAKKSLTEANRTSVTLTGATKMAKGGAK
jgi:zinc protease